MPTVTFVFPDEETQRAFLTTFSCGGEQVMSDRLSVGHNIEAGFTYDEARSKENISPDNQCGWYDKSFVKVVRY